MPLWKPEKKLLEAAKKIISEKGLVNSNMNVLNYGISKAHHTDFDPDELLKDNGISVEDLANVIKNYSSNGSLPE